MEVRAPVRDKNLLEKPVEDFGGNIYCFCFENLGCFFEDNLG